MKATLKGFTGSYIREQHVGGSDEVLDADVSCTFVLDDGRQVGCMARLKQTVGSDYKQEMIEVWPVRGLPDGAEYDHNAFAEQARRY